MRSDNLFVPMILQFWTDIIQLKRILATIIMRLEPSADVASAFYDVSS